MREPLTLEEFAEFVRLPAEELERYRAAGLLDPDRDGRLDDYDLPRLQYVLRQLELGKSVDAIAAEVAEGRVDVPLVGDLLFPRPQRGYTVDEAAEKLGLSPRLMEALRTAVGLPGSIVLEDDLEGFAGAKAMVEGGLPWEAILEAARVYGDSFRRMAEMEARLLHTHVHERLVAAGATDQQIAEANQAMMEALEGVIDPLLGLIHRQHLMRAMIADALLHMESEERAARPGTFETTIAFVDLTSFTALANVHGDEVAAQVLDRFDELVRSLVHEHGGALIKQIGDAFMLTFREPADAVRFAVKLDATASREEHFPALKVGINHGEVIYRVGDYIGTTVNLASRLATAAMPHEIVMPESVARAVEVAGVPVEPVGVRVIRGISDSVALFKVARGSERTTARDPVCGMMVSEQAAGRLTRKGAQYVFCSEDCLRRFLEDPDRYAVVTG